MKRPQPLVWGLIWVSVVVVACAVTWVVIDSVGSDVLDGTQPEQLPVARSTQSTGSPTARPRRTPSPDTTTSSSPPTADLSTPSPVQDSWYGPAGFVIVSCIGSAASLESASPNDGWGMEIDKQGPDEVRVEFETGGDDEQRTRVRVECGPGGPQIEVDD